jgi:hypothetical protein
VCTGIYIYSNSNYKLRVYYHRTTFNLFTRITITITPGISEYTSTDPTHSFGPTILRDADTNNVCMFKLSLMSSSNLSCCAFRSFAGVVEVSIEGGAAHFLRVGLVLLLRCVRCTIRGVLRSLPPLLPSLLPPSATHRSRFNGLNEPSASFRTSDTAGESRSLEEVLLRAASTSFKIAAVRGVVVVVVVARVLRQLWRIGSFCVEPNSRRSKALILLVNSSAASCTTLPLLCLCGEPPTLPLTPTPPTPPTLPTPPFNSCSATKGGLSFNPK